MDIGSIFLVLGLFIIVGVYISRPFLEKRAALVSEVEQDQSALLAERDRVINALQELDFDFTLGKIPEGDYPDQREVLLKRGAEVLRQLDAYREDSLGGDLDSRLEATVATRRADTGRAQVIPNGRNRHPITDVADDQLETLIANRRRERNEKASGFCPKCGRPAQKSDRFCSNCGKTLSMDSGT